ncbi:MAG: metallophosphoesterase [Candidatus Bathyarchaeota archaeon]|jgi:calcineurin-like phosphoesterase family protein
MRYGDLGNYLFRYAIVSDTHISPEGESSSPWRVNQFSNDRTRWVISQINQANPEFVIHLGDIVHPLPHLPTYDSAAKAAKSIFEELEAPYHFLPGNHDVGDKNNPTVPAYIVDEHGLEKYRKWFGPLYNSFKHKGVLFVLINSLALNSGLEHEKKHSEWLESTLSGSERIHMFSHYPPYILEPSEKSNYDNIDQPARSWLLKLLKKHGVEAMFAGHAHQFIYNKHHSTEIYNLFSTSFVRQDYSDMFRVEAAEDYGRNDTPKLGWCIVDVYENAEVTSILRSYGSTLRKGEEGPVESPRVKAYFTKEKLANYVGVHLRHSWDEVMELPYNGPIDEFVRKRVRNDYAILGFWESGIRTLRVPFDELQEPRTRDRINTLTEMGHRFMFFCVGVPQGSQLKAIKNNPDLVDAIEIIIPWRKAQKVIDDLIHFRGKVKAPVYLAKIESSVERETEGPKFSHYISHGFRSHEIQTIKEYLVNRRAIEAQDGFIFHVSSTESPWEAIHQINTEMKLQGFRAVANIRLASEDPAENLTDDLWVANRVAEAVVAAHSSGVRVFLDTFMDLERGYFPRIGLYDRLLNPRMGSKVMANLQKALGMYGPTFVPGDRNEYEGFNIIDFENPKASFSLVLPRSTERVPSGMVEGFFKALGGRKITEIIDLVSGTIYKTSYVEDIPSNSLPYVPFLCVLEKRVL